MMEENFARGDSLLHNRSPRVKLIASASLLIVVAISNNFQAVGFALGVALMLLFVSGLSLRSVGKRLLIANSFTLFLWISLPMTYSGGDFIQLGSVLLSNQGVRLASLITLKTNTIILLIILLPGTSTIAELGHSLQSLGVPKKLCFLLLFSYRYIFVIHQEYKRLKRAATIRCFSPATNLHTYRTYGYLFGMTLVHSVNRSHRIYQAMKLRGFNGQLIPLTQMELRRGDVLFLIIFLLLSAGLVVIPSLQ